MARWSEANGVISEILSSVIAEKVNHWPFYPGHANSQGQGLRVLTNIGEDIAKPGVSGTRKGEIKF